MLPLRAAQTRLGAGAIRTGVAVTGWEEGADGGSVTLSTGETVRGSIFVAADGIHSVARKRLYPDEGIPLWCRVLMWRGTTWAPGFLTGRSMAMAGCKARKFVCHPIGERDGEEGPEVLVNWIADLMFPPDHQWLREDWSRAGYAADLLPKFGDWHFDWLDVPAIISGADRIYQWPMVDRDPLPRWTHGRMTLLGDAAHPMYPIGSNGASQAILDARVLAREIRDRGASAAALEAYDAERRPRTAAVVLANRGDGPDKVLDIVEERAPDGLKRLDDVISQVELEEIAAAYKATAGMDVEALNGAPAILSAG